MLTGGYFQTNFACTRHRSTLKKTWLQRHKRQTRGQVSHIRQHTRPGVPSLRKDRDANFSALSSGSSDASKMSRSSSSISCSRSGLRRGKMKAEVSADRPTSYRVKRCSNSSAHKKEEKGRCFRETNTSSKSTNGRPHEYSNIAEDFQSPPRHENEGIADNVGKNICPDPPPVAFPPTGGTQPAVVTGPEASKEMRRAILCLLTYSHRQVQSARLRFLAESATRRFIKSRTSNTLCASKKVQSTRY